MRETIMDQKALTIEFWNLQLYLMESRDIALKMTAVGMIRYSSKYKTNKFTPKAIKLMTKKNKLTEDEHNCLSTHIALQIVGIYD